MKKFSLLMLSLALALGLLGCPAVHVDARAPSAELASPAQSSGKVGSYTPTATGVAGWMATPSSTNLATALTDESGSGAAVFASSPVLTSPTASNPTLSGVVTLAGSNAITSNDVKGFAYDYNPVNVQTTDATVTTLQSINVGNNGTTAYTVLVAAQKSDNSQGAAYSISAAFRQNSGTVSQIGTTSVTVIGEDDATWDATSDFSGTTARVRVTGKAATTIRWTAIVTALYVTP